jgi:uncharacterized membrane protein
MASGGIVGCRQLLRRRNRARDAPAANTIRLIMKRGKIYKNALSPAMTGISTLLLLASISACGAQENADQDPVAREQELAKDDVWHAAKLRGVAFRAIGQEPGWLLEITNGEEILIVTNYGQDKESHPYVEPQVDQAARKTVYPVNDSTSVLIEGEPCTDSMSGESFRTTVTVTLGGKAYAGCGRALF